ncbi:hypothetical protein [Blastococcus sp. DSM 46786]|uniref:hypothetical protein n=1 Tax=Blastococcus sp. DSM 46786 TaxID=1798227 RepID=UPI001479B927|nr:hypothetical protein [Blastococcus sp. DSM 46786]
MELPEVELRPLRRADLPLLARWLAEPLVSRWWRPTRPPGGRCGGRAPPGTPTAS